MKKCLLIALAILTAGAFIPRSADAGVGIKGGISYSNITLKAPEPPPFSFESLRSPVGGLFFGVPRGPITLQPELLYVRMGTKYIADLIPVELRIQYIQLPLLLKFNVMPAGPIRPNVFAGPYGSFRLSARAYTSGVGVNVNNLYKKTDYGIVVGGGLDFKLGVLALTVDARYNLGMTNIWVPVSPEDTGTVKNKAFMIMAGISF